MFYQFWNGMFVQLSQVSSSYHPHAGLGYVPYNELLAFLSLATSGAYLPRAPEV